MKYFSFLSVLLTSGLLAAQTMTIPIDQVKFGPEGIKVQCDIGSWDLGSVNNETGVLQSIEVPVEAYYLYKDKVKVQSFAVGKRLVSVYSNAGKVFIQVNEADQDLRTQTPLFIASYNNFEGHRDSGGFTGLLRLGGADQSGADGQSDRLLAIRCNKL